MRPEHLRKPYCTTTTSTSLHKLCTWEWKLYKVFTDQITTSQMECEGDNSGGNA